mmetsp:Transcript_101304/g.315740  ORF Transcript_101304/g.315740 Transcript_101304/m.315740 type:complete len:705 (-) Transcript_101304:85-2199(-)
MISLCALPLFLTFQVAATVDTSPGEFVTSAESFRTFAWTQPTRSLSTAFGEAFLEGNHNRGWQSVTFAEAASANAAAPLTREKLLYWAEHELLGGPDPFAAHGGRVPLPWPRRGGLGCKAAWEERHDSCRPRWQGSCDTVFSSTSDAICECEPPPGTVCSPATWVDTDHSLICGECKVLAKRMSSHYRTCRAYCAAQQTQGIDDQLGAGQYVGYSRRQLCFIAAKSLVGAGTAGYDNGLKQYLEEHGAERCLPRTGDFGRALFSLLATCAVDPGLAAGGQGPLILVAKPLPKPDVPAVRAHDATPLSAAGLRVCQYDDGTAAGSLPGVPTVPAAGCAQPTADGPGKDFMTAEALPGQGLQDISAAFFGGYVFGNACGLGGGQDERLMTYMPEVAALAFFLSEKPGRPQLRQPAWVLGARMLFKGLDGTARWDQRMEFDSRVPLVRDLVPVELGGKVYKLGTSRPFLAFMSENQGSLTKFEPIVRLARRNRHPEQREFHPESWFAFDKQVRAWYWSVALSSYPQAVRPILKASVKSLGSGPWLAGLWWGDSQLGILATWLGHTIAAPSWGAGAQAFPLDYYIYSAFTENPGNMCFLHSHAACRACQRHCLARPLPETAYWMPDDAFFGDGPTASCAYAGPDDCGGAGLADIYAAYAGKTAGELWRDVEAALRHNDYRTDRTVFDLLLPRRAGAAGRMGSNATLYP